jgi:hypothetical protein
MQQVGRANQMAACHRFFQNKPIKLKTVTGRAGGLMQSDDKRLVWSKVLTSGTHIC